jgi:putative transcriptional regulator
LKARIRLKELLLQHKVSINKLSIETGISRQTLTNWCEHPLSRVEIDKVNKVCNHFGCNIKDFLEFVEEPKKAGA